MKQKINNFLNVKLKEMSLMMLFKEEFKYLNEFTIMVKNISISEDNEILKIIFDLNGTVPVREIVYQYKSRDNELRLLHNCFRVTEEAKVISELTNFLKKAKFDKYLLEEILIGTR